MEGKTVDVESKFDTKEDRGDPKIKINLLSDIKDYRLPQVNINESFEHINSDTSNKYTLGSFERLKIPQTAGEYKLVAASTSFFEKFALDDKKVLDYEEDLALYFTGSKLLRNSYPISSVYFDDNYGQFQTQRKRTNEVYLGTLEKTVSLSNNDILLKGSCIADIDTKSACAKGISPLRSCLLEFLCCEAMAGLNIPTINACGVTRHTDAKRGTLMLFSKSYLHFANFLSPSTDSHSTKVGLENMDYVKKLIDGIHSLFPESSSIYKKMIESKFCSSVYLDFFCNVVESTAYLLAMWQAIGFVHGNLKPENLNIFGLGKGYDRFTFLDEYDTDFLSNLMDKTSLYSFKNQNNTCREHCRSLGRAIIPLCMDSRAEVPSTLEDMIEEILKHSFDNVYKDAYWEELRKKAGLPTYKGEEDIELLQDLLNLMDESKIDYHNVWVALEKIEMPIQWPFHWEEANEATSEKEKEKLEVIFQQGQNALDEVLCNVMRQVATIDEKRAMVQRVLYDDKKMEAFVDYSMTSPENLFLNHTSNSDIQKHMDFRLASSTFDAMDPDHYYRGIRKKWVAWLEKYMHRLENEIDYDALFERPPPEPVESTGATERETSPSKKKKKKKKNGKKERKEKKAKEEKKKKKKKKKWGKKTPYKLLTKAVKDLKNQRRKHLKNRNPRLVLRRYIAKEAIDEAINEQKCSKFRALALALRNPYDPNLYDRSLKQVYEKKWQYDDLRARRYGGRVLSEHLSTRHASGNSNTRDVTPSNTNEVIFPYLEEKKIYLRDMHIGFELIHTKKMAPFPYLSEKPRALDRLIYDYEKI